MAARLLRQVEGCVLHPYRDSAGVWTIGIGTTRIYGLPVTEQTPPITLDQAEAYCETDMQWVAAAIAKYVTVPLAPHEWAALASFTYNEGAHALATSTLLRVLNLGKRDYAADQFAAWNMAGGRVVQGLVNRRRLEKAVFLGLTPV